MNLSFFRRWKSQSSSTSISSAAEKKVTAPTAAAPPSNAATPEVAAPNECLEITIETLLPLLPESAVRQAPGVDASKRVRLPLKQILPQLAKGRVVVSLGEVLSQLPAEMLVAPASHAGSEKLSLPLDQVVSNLSPEALKLREDQRQVELEGTDIPSPFAEELPSASGLVDQTPLLVETPAEKSEEALFAERTPVAETPVADSALPARAEESSESDFPRPLFEPAPIRDVASPPPVPASGQDADEWRKQWIYIPLGDLLDCIPDSALAGEREMIRPRVDLSYRVPVSLEEVVPQLGKGRITLELSKLAGKFPEGVLAPSVSGPIALGVDKVIDQVPPSVFSGTEEQQGVGIEEIPSPFQEVCREAEVPTPIEEPVQPETQARTEQPSVEEVIPVDLGATEPLAETPEEVAPFTPQETPRVSAEPETASAEVLAAEVPPTAEAQPSESNIADQPSTEQPETEVPAVRDIAPEPPKKAEPEKIESEPIVEALQQSEPVVELSVEAPVEPQIAAPAEAEADDLDSIGASEVELEPAIQPVAPEAAAKALNDLNSWTEDDLHQHTLGPTLTQRILDYRAQKGGFKDLRELMQIAGIGPRLFERVLGFRPESLDDQKYAVNRLLGVSCDHEMSLQEIVKCSSRMPGVEGCIVAMKDGLYMTGELPRHMDSQRVSAFAPQLFSRVSQYVHELNVGNARRITIFTDAQPISIFKANDLFFIVIHKANRFSKVLLNKCERISQEISRICSKETAKS